MISVRDNYPIGKWTVLVAVLFVLLVLESGFFGRFGFLPAIPQLLTVFVACLFTFQSGYRDSLYAAIITGVFLDFVSGTPDGIMLLAGLLSYGTVVFVSKWFFAAKSSALPAFFLNVLLITVSNFAGVLGLSWLFAHLGLGEPSDARFLLVHGLPWVVLINLLVAYPLAALYSFLDRQMKFEVRAP